MHSQALGESLNVGVLFVFPEERRVFFKAPERLKRLIDAYPTQSDSHIRSYLKTFENKAKQLDDAWEIETDYELLEPKKFITKNFLYEDASALIFSEPNFVVKYTQNILKIAEDYTCKLLTGYEAEQTEERHNERFIIRQYSKSLSQLDENILHKVVTAKEDLLIIAPKTELQFDFGWQNGTYNLVKAVSFDLKESSSINDKAVNLYGKLHFLNNLAIEKNYRFDLLVSRPQDKNLFKAYDRALEILEDSKTNKEIIEEEAILTYSERTVGELMKEL